MTETSAFGWFALKALTRGSISGIVWRERAPNHTRPDLTRDPAAGGFEAGAEFWSVMTTSYSVVICHMPRTSSDEERRFDRNPLVRKDFPTREGFEFKEDRNCSDLSSALTQQIH